MSLDEKSISATNEYFAEIAQSAVNAAYEESDPDTTFAEFMETLTNYLHRLASEHVASEVLAMSSRSIESYNNGSGIYVDDVQALIEEKENEDEDDVDDEENEELY